MNRVASGPPVYEYLSLDFRISAALVETAQLESDQLRSTIAKIICYSLFAFLAIAAFESFVVNGAKLALNVGIWMLNMSNSLFFQKEDLEPPPPPPLPISVRAEIVTEDEPLPPIHPLIEAEFFKVFKILATANIVFELPFHTPYLADFRERTKHLHPLQVIGCLLEKNSLQREDAIFVDRAILGKTFVSDTTAGFAEPAHAESAPKYMASFAEKVGVHVDVARAFLLQKPPHLMDFVHHVLRQP